MKTKKKKRPIKRKSPPDQSRIGHFGSTGYIKCLPQPPTPRRIGP